MVQKCPLFNLFFWGNIGPEIFLYDILEWKHAFLGSKNKKFKKSKNWHFSKGIPRNSKGRIINIFTNGLTNGFGPKLAHFPTFFFGNKCQQNVFYNILERKNTLLGYKNKKFKKSKNWHFSKGVNPWFWSGAGHFTNFFFLANIRK